MRWSEVVPAAPLLPILAEVVAFAVAFGLCVLAIKFCRALFGTVGSALGWIPWLGSKVQGPLSRIEQKLTDELGQAANALDKRMGQAWHRLASTTIWLGRELAAHASTLLAIAEILQSPLNIPAWRTFWRSIHGKVDAIPGTITRVVRVVTKPVTATVGRLDTWTRSRIRAMEHVIDVTIPRDIAGLRKRVGAAERAANDAWKWVRSHEGLFGGLAFAGLVTAALGRLGLGWIRCSNWKSAGKQICATDPSLIESLLADTLLIATTLSLVEFAKEMQTVTEQSARIVQEFWRVG